MFFQNLNIIKEKSSCLMRVYSWSVYAKCVLLPVVSSGAYLELGR